MVIFLVLGLGLIISFLFFLSDKSDFVVLEDDKFTLNGDEFYPITLNYCVSLQMNDKGVWACPSSTYNTNNPFPYSTKDSSLLKLKADMTLIKAMGYNSVRICRVGEPMLDKDKNGELSIGAHLANQDDTSLVLSNNEANYKAYFNALDEMFEVINEVGLKVVFLLRMHPDYPSTHHHLVKISTYFKEEPTIMAYDFYNEPLYGDLENRTKLEVFNTVKQWDSIFKAHDQIHLSTIGLEGIGEVFEWDPNILDVDLFLTIHTTTNMNRFVMKFIGMVSILKNRG